MPATLQPNDRKLLIVTSVVLVVILLGAALFRGPQQERDYPTASSFSSEKDGARAAYLLLGELGYAEDYWEQPFSELPESASETLLIIASPELPKVQRNVSKLGLQEDRDALAAFMARGGRVLAAGKDASELLSAAVTTAERHSVARVSAVLPSRLTLDAPAIEMDSEVHWQSKNAEEAVQYADKTGPLVVSYAVGKGQAIWWADSLPLTNEGLPRRSNMRLLLNCVGGNRTRILWDEHLHGEHKGLVAVLDRTPAKWLMAQFLLVFAATLLTFSRRHGPLVALRPGATRLSPLEFVETLGDLYRRKGAAPEALETAWLRFRFELGRRLGLGPTPAIDAMAAAAAERWSWRDPSFLDMLRQCERAEHLHQISEKDALRLIGEMHVCRERMNGA
jgi:hypothetical protein